MAKIVIDVSQHQGVIGWEKVKSKVSGAVLRCGYGSDITSQDDTQFKRNLSECERLGIPKGVYLYSYAVNEGMAKSELAHILRLIKGHKFELPIYVDCEEPGTQDFAPTACNIICEGLKKAGFTPGVYANTSWWQDYLKSVTGYSRWVAQFNNICTYTGTKDMWQYTENGSISGISGYVDISYCYNDDFFKTDNKPTDSKKTVAEIAKEVIQGKWGNGTDRVKRLTDAGYNYNEVQRKVNELLTRKTVTEIAKEVIAGKWGNGDERKKRLTAAGYDYAEVQAEVNRLMSV